MTASSAKSWAGSAANLLLKLLHLLHPSRHELPDRREAATAMAVRNAANGVRRVVNAVSVAVAASVANGVAVVSGVRVVSAKSVSAMVRTGSVVVASAVRVRIASRSLVSSNVHRPHRKPLNWIKPTL